MNSLNDLFPDADRFKTTIHEHLEKSNAQLNELEIKLADFHNTYPKRIERIQRNLSECQNSAFELTSGSLGLNLDLPDIAAVRLKLEKYQHLSLFKQNLQFIHEIMLLEKGDDINTLNDFVILFNQIPIEFENTRLFCKERCEKLHSKLQDDVLKTNIDQRSHQGQIAIKESIKLLKLYRQIESQVSMDYPLRGIINPILNRIRFHFLSNKPTNRKDKPEWLFSHVIKVIGEQIPFIIGSIQPLYQDFAIAHELLIDRILGVVKQRISSDIPKIVDSELYPHYIQKVLEFDEQLRAFVKEGDECIFLFLRDRVLCDKWISMEVDIATHKIVEVNQSADFFTPALLDMDDINVSKHLKSSDIFLSLLESILDRINLVTDRKYKLKLFESIVLPVMNIYIQSLKEISGRSMDKFVSSGYQIIQSDIHLSISQRYQILSSNYYLKETLKTWETKEFFVGILDDVLDPIITLFKDMIQQSEQSIIEDIIQNFTMEFNVNLDKAVTFLDKCYANIEKFLRQKYAFGLAIRIAKRIDIFLMKNLVLQETFDDNSVMKFRGFFKKLISGNISRIHKNPSNMYRMLKDTILLCDIPLKDTQIKFGNQEIILTVYNLITFLKESSDKEAEMVLQELGVSSLDSNSVIEFLKRRGNLNIDFIGF